MPTAKEYLLSLGKTFAECDRDEKNTYSRLNYIDTKEKRKIKYENEKEALNEHRRTKYANMNDEAKEKLLVVGRGRVVTDEQREHKNDRQRKNYEATKEVYEDKKRRFKNKWTSRDVSYPDGDFDKVYDIYDQCNNCMSCGHDFSISCKCLDHDHITGMYRRVICKKCNDWDAWKNKQTVD